MYKQEHLQYLNEFVLKLNVILYNLFTVCEYSNGLQKMLQNLNTKITTKKKYLETWK